MAPGSADDLHCSFIRGCSLLIHDSQYTNEEYQGKVGWGHSTWEYVIHMAAWAQVRPPYGYDASSDVGVGTVALFHHDPRRSDEQVDAILAAAREKMLELTEDTAGIPTKVIAAQEQWSLEVQPAPVTCGRVSPYPSTPSTDLDCVPSFPLLPTPPLSPSPPTSSATVVGCACSGGNPDAPLPGLPCVFADASLPCTVVDASLPCMVADASLPCLAAHGGVDPAPDDQNDTNASCALIEALTGEGNSAAPSVTDKCNTKAALGDKVEAPVEADARFPAAADAKEPVFELVMFVMDARVLSLLRQALAEEPRIVICHAASEGELMEMAETRRPSLVLLGKNLPGVDGGGPGLHLRMMDRLGHMHSGLVPMLVCEDGQRPAQKNPTGPVIREFLDHPFSPAYARTRILCIAMRRQCRWVAAPFPPDEEKRLAATHALSLLYTERETKYDLITKLAAAVFQTDLSVMTLMDLGRCWFKAYSLDDLAMKEMPRDTSICQYTLLQNGVMEVEDALMDDRFADIPNVRCGFVRFYAAVPLKATSGHNVGTLCIVHGRPKKLSPKQREELWNMGELVSQLIQTGHTPLPPLQKRKRVAKEEEGAVGGSNAVQEL
eukprot:jgi/Mesvir1/7730/Mv11675-RA.1